MPESLENDEVVIGVDIGGTKIEAGIVSVSGSVMSRCRAATPAHGSADEMWASVRGLIDDQIGRCSSLGRGAPLAIGVGCGGPMTAGGEAVSPLNISAWRGFPLHTELVEKYDLPCTIDNDAKALARAEGTWGAASGLDNFLSMVVSTGVGGGIVLDGEMLDGSSGNAGHIGHLVVEPSGRKCVCGATGCLEAQVSGTAIAEITNAPAAQAPIELRRRTGELVGRAVASTMALLDFDSAFVAGSVALGFGADFFEAAQAELDRQAVIGFLSDPTIQPSGMGSNGPLLGAASVGFSGLA